MKRIISKAISLFVAVIPVIAEFAMLTSANNVASPFIGQPIPPKKLKKYRKF